MNFWLGIGLFGQLMFSARFFVQWICSERKKESYIPLVFWHLSIGGGLLLLIYSIYRKDPVFIIGQSVGVVIYTRNLILIYRKSQVAPESSDQGMGFS